MTLAVSTPLPLWTTATAQSGAALLRALGTAGPVHALVENVYRVEPGLVPREHLHLLCDLPHLIGRGTIRHVIYSIGDDALHVHQLAMLARVPGLVVLHDVVLAKLRAAMTVRAGGREVSFVRGFTAGDGLAAEIAARAHTVVVPRQELADELRRCGAQNVQVVPELAGDPAAAAARVRAFAEAMPPASVGPDDRELPSVTALVIGYNSKDIVGPCLQTLLDQDYPNLEVVVVDNASKDGTAEFIKTSFPAIRLIESPENLGFAEGNNLVFRTTKSKYVVLLNQDAYANRNWVRELVAAAELDDSIASVGSKMLMYRCPTILNSTAIEINEGGWGWDRNVGERDDNPSPTPEDVLGGCGGAVLYRKAALDHAGGFDRAFFMYYEDTDLAWRLRLCGYRNLYAPLAVVRHDFHGDTGATPGRLFRRRFMSERNRWATLVKNADWAWLREFVPKIRRYDKGRVEWLERAAREGHNPQFHGEIAQIIRRAWRWNLLRLVPLLLRRRRTQRLRRAEFAEVRKFIVKGINEGGHQGDVENTHDRYSAKPRARIVMGPDDLGSLGGGWHGVEHPPGAPAAYRWCKDRAWFYLQIPEQARALTIRLGSPIEPHQAALYAESHLLAEWKVPQGMEEFRFELPASLPRGELLEFTLRSETVRPVDRGLSPDVRTLGVVVFAIGAE